jgi:hypothetical protein
MDERYLTSFEDQTTALGYTSGDTTLVSPQVSLIGTDVVYSKEIPSESRIRFAKDEETGKLYFIVDVVGPPNVDVVGPADNEIWYTTNGQEGDHIFDQDWQYFIIRGNQCLSRTFNNDKYILTFRDPITAITSYFSEAMYKPDYITSIVIPNIVTDIEFCAFEGLSGLEHITIPNSVTFIGARAFGGCKSLTSITIPESVTDIESRAFNACCFSKDNFINNSSLDAEANDYWGAMVYDYRTNSVFVRDNVVIKGEGGVTSIVIPDNVIGIGDGAFSGCIDLTSITIPNSITSIGNSAFTQCSLRSITIPENVMSIGSYAFDYCHQLASITFGGTIEQWNAIEKGNYWRGDNDDEGYIPATYVQCSDGQVPL